MDPAGAVEALRQRLGPDPQKLLAEHKEALDTLQFILAGRPSEQSTTPRKLLESPAGVGVAAHGKTVELQGPFAVASTLSENLLLEYANGMQGETLGWGRLTRDNLFRVLELHRVYADLMRRTALLARSRIESGRSRLRVD